MTITHSRAVLARAAGAAAIGLCAAWLGGTSPAQARDRIDDRDVNRAKDACRQVAENRDWKDIRTDVRDRDEDRGRVIVTVRGKRSGDDRERECTYDVRDQRAELDDQDRDSRDRDDHGGGRTAERARDACRQVAENRGWRDIREDVRNDDRDRDVVVVQMRGKRDGDDRERECRYDARRGDADFRD